MPTAKGEAVQMLLSICWTSSKDVGIFMLTILGV